jgi:OTT_1508-like deaminase
LRHVIGRLASYQDAVEVILSARQKWEDLFNQFSVQYIPPSKPAPNPIKKKNTCIHDLLGRFTSDPENIARYRAQALELERLEPLELAKRVSNKFHADDFHPIVHAEVLLHDWLKHMPGNMRPESFFRNWQYIGSSKPTCRLCHYYFAEQNDGVQVRDPHMNLYVNWRLPDIHRQQPRAADAVAKRRRLLTTIRTKVREVAVQTMHDKQPVGKADDSNTSSSRPTDLVMATAAIGADEYPTISAALAKFRLPVGNHERQQWGLRPASPGVDDAVSIIASNGDDYYCSDLEDGGGIL